MDTDANPPRLSSYRQLIAWQKAIDLVADIYQATESVPKSEIYGLTSQLRRSAVSIPSNIAEGQGRATRGEFVQFLGHARGSIFELETQITIVAKLNYISAETEQNLAAKATEVARILNGLMTSLGVSTRRTQR